MEPGRPAIPAARQPPSVWLLAEKQARNTTEWRGCSHWPTTSTNWQVLHPVHPQHIRLALRRFLQRLLSITRDISVSRSRPWRNLRYQALQSPPAPPATAPLRHRVTTKIEHLPLHWACSISTLDAKGEPGRAGMEGDQRWNQPPIQGSNRLLLALPETVRTIQRDFLNKPPLHLTNDPS